MREYIEYKFNVFPQILTLPLLSSGQSSQDQQRFGFGLFSKHIVRFLIGLV
jgi:hypothetical protein